jgi:alpha-L-fucosidase 2
MQSANGEMHLLPALPDVWTVGKVSGIKAIGGFEVVSLEWKDSKLVKVVIKSNLGGNLRLRTSNAVALNAGSGLKKASGKNTNAFYEVEETPAALVSDKATIVPLELKETMVYDLPTQAGKTYTLIAQ